MTLITFREHKFRKEGKYKCECGYRFKRTENTYWTENPFNTDWEAGHPEKCDERAEKKLIEKLEEKECPKCDRMCKRIKR